MNITSSRSSCITLLAYCLLTASTNVSAQEAKRIEDNSFLLEEAYNQEEGVIQYIVVSVFKENQELELHIHQRNPGAEPDTPVFLYRAAGARG